MGRKSRKRKEEKQAKKLNGRKPYVLNYDMSLPLHARSFLNIKGPFVAAATSGMATTYGVTDEVSSPDCAVEWFWETKENRGSQTISYQFIGWDGVATMPMALFLEGPDSDGRVSYPLEVHDVVEQSVPMEMIFAIDDGLGMSYLMRASNQGCGVIFSAPTSTNTIQDAYRDYDEDMSGWVEYESLPKGSPFAYKARRYVVPHMLYNASKCTPRAYKMTAGRGALTTLVDADVVTRYYADDENGVAPISVARIFESGEEGPEMVASTPRNAGQVVSYPLELLDVSRLNGGQHVAFTSHPDADGQTVTVEAYDGVLRVMSDISYRDYEPGEWSERDSLPSGRMWSYKVHE